MAVGVVKLRAGGSQSRLNATVVAVGDIARCNQNGDEATAKLVEHTQGTVLALGDNAYDAGSDREYQECYDPAWGRFRQRTHPVPGNHDYETADAAGYFHYFGDAAGKGYYSFDLGAWHLVALDSNCGDTGGCGPDDPQGRWLRADLAESSAKCTLAFWHHPRFSSGKHGANDLSAPFWEALYEAGADLVLNGHDHDYERFAPQSPAGQADESRGIREFVVGTGGGNLRPFSSTAANSERRLAETYGVLALKLRPGAYDWRFVTADGDTADKGSGACH